MTQQFFILPSTGSPKSVEFKWLQTIEVFIRCRRAALISIQYALGTLRHLRDNKPREWDALVTPGLCSVWDELKRIGRLAKEQEKV